ncbi:MAG: capsular polysaccharide synthesis protein [Clostridiales bacterium]|nr:capsular polysaccharide synthesis protein [Clostridiales bacterium]
MIRSLTNLCKHYKEYGFRCTWAYLLCMLLPYSEDKNGKWRRKIIQHKYTTLTDYLYRHYFQTPGNDRRHIPVESSYTNCIWTAWLQGEENAPEVIRITIASMRRYANGHPVVVISNDNVDRYIDLPQTIKRKHESGVMGHAHYADVIRMMILEKYGGLWLDATMLLHEPIPEEAFRRPFYSMGFRNTNGEKYISKNKWLVRVIGGEPNSVYLAQISRMLCGFWEEHNIAIDYFVFDYLVFILYKYDDSFRSIINELPQMEQFTNAMAKIINEPFDQRKIEELYIQGQLYTLTYRKKYSRQTAEGHMTFYGYLYNTFLQEPSKESDSDS